MISILISLLISFAIHAEDCEKLPYGNEKIFGHAGAVISAKISGDGTWVVSGTDKQELKISNLKTHKTVSIDLESEVQSLAISESKGLVSVGLSNGLVKLFSLSDTKPKIIQTYKHWEKVNALAYSPNGLMLASGSTDGRVILVDLSNKKQKIFTINSVVKSLRFFPDGKSILLGTSDGRVISIQDRPVTLLQKTYDINSVDVSFNGRFIAAGGNEGLLFLRDTVTKKDKYFFHSNDVVQVAFSPDGTKLASASSDHKVKIIDVNSGLPFEIDNSTGVSAVAFSPDSKQIAIGNNGGTANIVNIISRKIRDQVRHRDSITSLMFSPDGLSLLTAGLDKVVKLTEIKSICSSQVKIPQGPSTICELQSIFLKSVRLYEALIEKDPALAFAGEPDKACPLPVEKKAIEYLTSKIAKTTGPTVFNDWLSLAPLVSVYRKMKSEEQEKYHELVAQSLAFTAVSRELKGVFVAKAFKLAYRATRVFLGDGKNFYTDMTYIRTPEEITPVVLGLSPIDNDAETKTPYGFYAKKYPAIPLPDHSVMGQELEVFNGAIQWFQGSKQFTSHLHVRALDKAAIFSEGNSPDYVAMKKDKKFVGLIITGVSLDIAKDVLEYYKEYFEKDGFKFQSPVPNVDVEEYLLKGISNGEIDYFVKEAHTDGDDRNIFEMNKTGTVLTGVKHLKDDIEEIIHLVLPPSKNNQDSVVVSNQSFGEAIRQREQNGASPFIYVNSSCWSATKAIHEIEMARSPLLIDIATLNTVDTFTDKPTNPMRIVIDGIRRGQNYDELRQGLTTNSDYASGKSNHFIFPDEMDYQNNVKAALNVLLDINLKITDESGSEYFPDLYQP